jgi:outer membrane protein assembly factor BamB
MKLIKKYNNCDFLGLIDNKTVIWYKDHIEFGNLSIPTQEGDDYVIWHGSKAVSRKRNGKRMLLFDKEFVLWPEGRFGLAMSQDNFKTSFNIDGDTFNVSTFIDDKELVLHIKEPSLDMEDFMLKSICENKSKDVIIISTGLDKNPLLFYSKTGEFLWQYTDVDANLKINWKCIPVVDDVVVIISQDCGVMGKVQGFNIRTGEKLWELDRRDRICSNTFFVGEDKMLYGCIVLYFGGIAELNLCEINPFTGKLERTVVLKDNDLDVCSWLVTMHGRRLYYADNRDGKEIGVIDVDRKEIVERQPLEIKKNVTIGAPVVTDDRMYVYIRELNELRVYEL